MKHAFLITAYRDFLSLEENLDQLLKINDAIILITVDKKQKEFIKKIQENSHFINNSRVQWRFDLTINWGSYAHVQAYLDMCQQAINHDADYFHSMTGQCKVIVEPSKFIDFFKKSNGQSYLEYFNLPKLGWDGKLGGFGRIKFWQLYDFFDARKYGKFFKRANQYFVSIQKLLRVSRIVKDQNYFGGSGYWSIHKDAAKHIIDELKISSNQWRYTFCPEECVYQTILLNSELKPTIVNDNLRFVLWGKQNGEEPGILDDRNLYAIQNSKKLIARKFDSRVSAELLKALFSKK
jgi:hypothetical protein